MTVNIHSFRKIRTRQLAGITGTSEPVVGLPPGTTVSIRPTAAGSAKIQYTFSPITDIIDETAVWKDWTAGAVTGHTYEMLVGAATGARCVATTGTWVFEATEGGD